MNAVHFNRKPLWETRYAPGIDMNKKKNDFGLIIRLLVGIAIGIAIGFYSGPGIMEAVVSLKHLLGEIIFYTIPLVIIGFIAPAIVRLGQRASKMLFAAVLIAYLSAVGAATMSAIAGYAIIPHLSVPGAVEGLRSVPKPPFELNIPQIMPVMSALVTALVMGVATAWTKAETFTKLLSELEQIMTSVVNRIVIPLLPFFIAATFAELAFEGRLSVQFPVFFKVILIVIVGHFVWLFILYSVAGLISGRNPLEVVRYYVPAYLTAVGTMSSAATLPVALAGASKSRVLSKTIVEFMIPLGATIHLCGSVLTETFFVMTISLLVGNALPSVGTMATFIILFGIFAVGAPGVPGGTVLASLGLVTGVLGFDSGGVALLLAIFALQDSFGTACNVTGDGALALIMEGLFNRNGELDNRFGGGGA